MKLVLIIGSGAVGKMSVGQALMDISDLRLFHNHHTIEPVLEVFGKYDSKVIRQLRDVFFEEFAKSDLYGMIFTYIWAFDIEQDRKYIEHVCSIFEPYGTQVYCIELIADQQERIRRSSTEHRLAQKASKRDVEASIQRMLTEDEKYRLVSKEGEIPFENYLRIDNTQLSPQDVALIIKNTFNL